MVSESKSSRPVLMTHQVQKTANVSQRKDLENMTCSKDFTATRSVDSRGTEYLHERSATSVHTTKGAPGSDELQCETARFGEPMEVAKADDQSGRDVFFLPSNSHKPSTVRPSSSKAAARVGIAANTPKLSM